jgi:hypothetical protein
MDGRHARAEGSIVIQAKHYHGSGFAALKSKMTKERQSIDRLAPTRSHLRQTVGACDGNIQYRRSADGWTISHNGLMEGSYATKEGAFEAIYDTALRDKKGRGSYDHH